MRKNLSSLFLSPYGRRSEKSAEHRLTFTALSSMYSLSPLWIDVTEYGTIVLFCYTIIIIMLFSKIMVYLSFSFIYEHPILLYLYLKAYNISLKRLSLRMTNDESENFSLGTYSAVIFSVFTWEKVGNFILLGLS